MRAVNPKPVTFTAVSKDTDTLPGGVPNHTKKQVAARIEACFVFIGADGFAQARIEARKYVASQNVDAKTKMPLAFDENEVLAEVQTQVLQRAIREYDAKEMIAGDPLFPALANVRELLEQAESNRLWREYHAYVAEEHPEGAPDKATFRDAEG